MKIMSATTWKTRGSSIVFDKEMLGPLLDEGCLVSLREVLSWLRPGAWPSIMPIGTRGKAVETVLVGGMDTLMEVETVEDAERFVQLRVRHLISEFQRHWGQEHGLVFGFASKPQQFVVSVREEVRYIRRDLQEIRLSSTLWNGAAAEDLWQLVRKDSARPRVVGGYYVPRVS